MKLAANGFLVFLEEFHVLVETVLPFVKGTSPFRICFVERLENLS